MTNHYNEIIFRQRDDWQGNVIYDIEFIRTKDGQIIGKTYTDVTKKAYINTFNVVCWCVSNGKARREYRRSIPNVERWIITHETGE